MRIRFGVVAVFAAVVPAWFGPDAGAASAKVPVVAAEDFWGSIARQVGGEHADVKSIIDDPEIHAHDYEPRPSDSAAFAASKVAIVNGIGYDPWAAKLVAANPAPDRQVVTVGEVVGVKDGGNPHQWYSPPAVERTVDAITEALKRADPTNAAVFDRRREVLRTEGFKRYNELRSAIRAQFAGTPVGASESIFAPLADDLGLPVLTPPSFQDAIAEGEDPTVADKATVDKQITGRQIKVFVYNSQNSTPDVAALIDKAKKAGIPVTTVTETPSPKGTSFQDWQSDQLQRLADALALATGKPAVPTGQAPAVPAPAAPAGGESLAGAAPQAPPPASTPPEVRPAPARQRSAAVTASGASDTDARAGQALARTGGSTRWLVLVAGVGFVLGGFAMAGGAPRRRRSANSGA